MLRGTDNVKNILQNNVSPTKHCYGSEQCYEYAQPFTWIFNIVYTVVYI